MPTPNAQAKDLIGQLPNPKDVAKALDVHHKALDLLEPVVNQFHRAFGGQQEIQAGIKDLRNKIVQAKAVLNE